MTGGEITKLHQNGAGQKLNTSAEHMHLELKLSEPRNWLEVLYQNGVVFILLPNKKESWLNLPSFL